MTIQQDLQQPAVVSPYVELYLIDGSAFGAPVFRLTPSSDQPVSFGTYGTFLPFPISGANWTSTTEQPPRPKLTLSNVNKVVQPYLQTYADMARAKVTRLRTLAKYLDDGSSPDATQTLPIEVYYISQKTIHLKDKIEFELVTMMDLPNVKLPLRTVLKDNIGGDTLYCPGVSIVRFR